MSPSHKRRTDYVYPASPANRPAFAEELCERIKSAFSGVKLGNGIGLWEAKALDYLESPKVRARYRLWDEAEDWTRIPARVLNRRHASPSFLDAEGFRFYMPAIMIATLRRVYKFDFIWHLIHFENLGHTRYELLNRQQRSVVREFLIFSASDPDDTRSRDDIMYALETHWTESSC